MFKIFTNVFKPETKPKKKGRKVDVKALQNLSLLKHKNISNYRKKQLRKNGL